MAIQLENRTCLHCGKTFQFRPYKSVTKTGRGKFCSRRCSVTVQMTIHGHTTHNHQSRTYSTWASMLGRCSNPGYLNYSRYGALGIRVCERWHTFENFLADMGEKPKGTSIDRIDGTRGYEPGNCRWATITEQQRNLKNNVKIEFRGKNQCLSAWAAELGINPSTLAYRIRRGYTPEQALTIVARYGNRVISTSA